MKNKICYAALFLFAVPLFFLNIRDEHNWGDDFAQYIVEARNIANGKPYHQSGYVFNPLNTTYAPPHYPPGYPLLLAPVVKTFGIAIRPMLYLNACLLAVMLFALFAFFRRHASVAVAVCMAVICVYSPAIFEYKQNVLSDLPCMVFVVAYFALRESKETTVAKQIVLIGIGTFAILIRTQAILLPLAELTLALFLAAQYAVTTKQVSIKTLLRDQGFLLGSGMLILYAFAEKILFASPGTPLSFYSNFFRNDDQSIWSAMISNARYVVSLFDEMFIRYPFERGSEFIRNLLVWLMMGFAVWGFVRSVRTPRTHHVFFLLTCTMLLVMPVHQGVRVIFMIAPIFLLYVKQGVSVLLRKLSNRQTSTVAIAFTTLYLLLGFDDYKRATQSGIEKSAYTPKDEEAFAYVQREIDSTEIVLFSKPRLLAMRTGVRSANIAWQRDYASNERFNDSLRIKYMLWRTNVSEPYFREYLYATESCADSIVLNNLYTLYKLK